MIKNYLVDKMYDALKKAYIEVKEEPAAPNPIMGVQYLPHTNVVSKDKLREIQINVLKTLSSYVGATYGPMGSNSMIVTGESSQSIGSLYSKDGLKVLKYIAFDKALELSIQSEMTEIARYVERKVGDGTTSSVILTANIFEDMAKMEKKHNIPPRMLIRDFKEVVADMEQIIESNGREVTIEDIYDICMISTNGNKEISENITNIYRDHGMNVNIDVGISNDVEHKLKIYDGMTIGEGYSDPGYINNRANGTVELHNPRVYAFADPIDTGEMISYLEKIILENVFLPQERREETIPTLIITPHISRDASALLSKLVELLYRYSAQNLDSQKPEVMILTNISGTDEGIYHDIAKLCRCKMIRKYIDPNVQKQHQESGDAPTIDNLVEWYGTCDLVVADADKTKFINPICMTEEGDTTYETIKSFLESEIKKAVDENADHLELARLKKRLRALEANMVEYLIGGITVADRDAVRDLVEDATKNCSSAVQNGVGYAANFEGLRAAIKVFDTENRKDKDSIKTEIAAIIFKAYYNAAVTLYSTVMPEEGTVKGFIEKSIDVGKPYNVVSIFNNPNGAAPSPDVLTSIRTDIEILEAISRIVTNMVTANQCLLQNPAVNKY